jgi:HNH endonuclease
MSYIPSSLRKTVIQRAESRCEYCHLSQKGQEATFHIDHVFPFVLGGETTLENLALACVSCSLRKSAKQIIVDSETMQEVSLFNPRVDKWNEHFQWDNMILVGLTSIARATIETLDLNRRIILAIREEEILLGRHQF